MNTDKLRSIVTGPNSQTKWLSTLLDIILKPSVKHIQSYIKDSLDFLTKCSRINTEYTVLTTFDICSLYTNILHEYGIEAIPYWINKHPEMINPRFCKNCIIEGLLFVLENNVFHFNYEYFKQILDTTMATDVAPSYSTLTVGHSKSSFATYASKGEDWKCRTMFMKTGAAF